MCERKEHYVPVLAPRFGTCSEASSGQVSTAPPSVSIEGSKQQTRARDTSEQRTKCPSHHQLCHLGRLSMSVRKDPAHFDRAHAAPFGQLNRRENRGRSCHRDRLAPRVDFRVSTGLRPVRRVINCFSETAARVRSEDTKGTGAAVFVVQACYSRRGRVILWATSPVESHCEGSINIWYVVPPRQHHQPPLQCAHAHETQECKACKTPLGVLASTPPPPSP